MPATTTALQGEVRGSKGIPADVRGCMGMQGIYVRASASSALGRRVGQMVQWYAHRSKEAKTSTQNRLLVTLVHVQSGRPPNGRPANGERSDRPMHTQTRGHGQTSWGGRQTDL